MSLAFDDTNKLGTPNRCGPTMPYFLLHQSLLLLGRGHPSPHGLRRARLLLSDPQEVLEKVEKPCASYSHSCLGLSVVKVLTGWLNNVNCLFKQCQCTSSFGARPRTVRPLGRCTYALTLISLPLLPHWKYRVVTSLSLSFCLSDPRQVSFHKASSSLSSPDQDGKSSSDTAKGNSDTLLVTRA